MSLNEKRPYSSPGLQTLKEKYAYVRFTEEEAIARALREDKLNRMDIAKVLNKSIRTVSRRLASAQKKIDAPKRNSSSRDLTSETFRKAKDIIGKAIQLNSLAEDVRPSCPECGAPRPDPKFHSSWQCRACGKIWTMDSREDPVRFKDGPECPRCGRRSGAQAWSLAALLLLLLIPALPF